MKLVIIDGQSGRMGALLAERIKAAKLPCEVLAVGTNAIATAAMMKAGADQGATGENPVLVACRDADIIAGPIGILMADALMGEISPAMAGEMETWRRAFCREGPWSGGAGLAATLTGYAATLVTNELEH